MSELSRRGFVGGLGIASALAGLAPARAFAGGRATVGGPAVVAVHLDQLYVDHSGWATPYVPPAGARSCDAVAHLDEAALLSLAYSI